jgi:hypothetical protein
MTTPNATVEQIFAKIDAWWSEWLRALEAVDDAEKLTPGVCEAWSVKDMMTHLAVWDLHAAEIAEQQARGQDGPEDDVQTINNETSARDAGMTLEQARTRMDDAHAEMLSRLRALDALEPEWVADDTYGHYPEHVDQIYDWLGQTADVRDADFSPDDVIDRVNTAWSDWLKITNGIATDVIDEAGVCGSWSVKDLLGHVAVWDREATAFVRREVAGQEHRLFDWRKVNDDEAERRRQLTLADLVKEMHATHADLVAALGAAPNLEAGWVASDTYLHYPQHSAQVRAWRAWRGV